MQGHAISIDGCDVSPGNLSDWSRGRAGLHAELASFLADWWSDSQAMPLQTSGSTGAPKSICAAKSAMVASACATCRAFDLKPGNSALLCLPLRYIAGKMMVVRALVGGLRLITTEPGSTPLSQVHETIDFAPLVPLQAATTLDLPDGAEQLARVRTILLGGGFVDPALEARLQQLPCRVFTSYGMTETLSHIALRAANGPERSERYTPLPGVHVSLSPAGTLQISAPYLGIDSLTTNDLAEIAPDASFRILGRVDAVINSGGVKIQAEQIEQELRRRTGLELVALPLPHPRLGQCVALLWEGPAEAEASLQTACAALPRYHRPLQLKRGILPRTETGKISRAGAIRLLLP